VWALDLDVPWFLALVAQLASTLSAQDRGVVDLAFPDRASSDCLIGVLRVQELDHHGGLTFACSWPDQPAHVVDPRVFPPGVLILRQNLRCNGLHGFRVQIHGLDRYPVNNDSPRWSPD
jgi:hypothetical protein